MKLRRLTLPGLILAVFFCCYPGGRAKAFGTPEESPRSPQVIIVMVDMSGSTNKARSTVYKEGFERVYRHLGQGDRVIVGTITSRSYIDFKPIVDVEIPKKTLWDNRLQFERNLTNTKHKIRSEVDKLLSSRKGTQFTEILNSLNIAETIFHAEKERRKILLILSDMIQDSKEYKFDKDAITPEYVNAVIKHRRQNNLVPNLSGVKVYVAGASAADSNRFRSVQAFWARYFAESGADFSPHRYGHSLINYENGS